MNCTLQAVLAGVLCCALPASAAANELRIETGAVARVQGADAVRVSASLRWRNAWRNERNHDAVWLVVKLRHGEGEAWSHGRVRSVRVGSGQPDATCEVSAAHMVMANSAATGWPRTRTGPPATMMGAATAIGEVVITGAARRRQS